MERKVTLQKNQKQVDRGADHDAHNGVSGAKYYYQEVWKHPNRVIRKYFCLDFRFR